MLDGSSASVIVAPPLAARDPKGFPAESVTFGEAIPGAAFSAVAWTLSALFFRVYATTADSVELFGVAGAVLLVLTWLYLGGLLLVLGAILNAVLTGRVDADEAWLPTEEAAGGETRDGD